MLCSKRKQSSIILTKRQRFHCYRIVSYCCCYKSNLVFLVSASKARGKTLIGKLFN
jgi:hypothetical protein